MMLANQQEVQLRERLLDEYLATRRESVSICQPLEAEDTCIQTMPDVSPPKWHLAHTSWFFETFLLSKFDTQYKVFDAAYDYLFNSYYLTHGRPYPRPERGLLSRPTLRQVLSYREHVDAAMQHLMMNVSESSWSQLAELITLGINHEQQHQELLYTDIKHIFAHNPLKPVYRTRVAAVGSPQSVGQVNWRRFEGGVFNAGHEGENFAFDNEGPAHEVLLRDFVIADRLVTNSEFLQFIDDDGYQRPEYWMSEGWACKQQQQWAAPLYWEHQKDTGNDAWRVFQLDGEGALEPDAPVSHISFYEADAYARWAGKRLPTEFEWEQVAKQCEVDGNLRDSGALQTCAVSTTEDINQIYGDVWEWTASPYTAYPGYKPSAGSIGEYNGKFMCNQMVLRGGSCVTPKNHIRATYRNFFYPPDRWQFSGLRLADDV